jgi:uncharacterized protein with PIN domain
MSDARRKRTEKRTTERQAASLLRDRERLFQLSAGGSSARPLELSSASIVESRAESLRCPRCDGRLRAVAHDAVTLQEVRLRKVRARCQGCGSERDVWLRVLAALN